MFGVGTTYVKKGHTGAVAGHTSSDRGLCRRQTSFHPAQDPSASSSKKNYVVTDSWNAQASTRGHQKAYIVARVFFLLWPLFARAPRHWFPEKFLLSAPGVQSVFFLLRSVGHRDLSAGPEHKKQHHPGCFFFLLRPRGKGRGRRSPVPARGQSKKKNTTQGVFYFCCGPGERQGKEKPRWAPARGQSKKKNTTQGVFFLLQPRGKAWEGEASLGAGTSAYASEPKCTRLSPWHCRARPAGPDRGAVRR